MKIAIINSVDQDRLNLVKKEMLALGTPKIKAVWMEVFGHWAALEGSHRVAAAYDLGLIPEIDEIEYSDLTLEDIGCDDSGDRFEISWICDKSYDSVIVEFN